MSKIYLPYETGKKDEIGIKVVTDIEPVLQENKDDRLAGDGFSEKRNLRRIGSIPMTVLMELGEKGVEMLHDGAAMKRFLRENPQYRTCEGGI